MNEEFEKMRAEFEAHMFSTGLVWDNSREDDGDGDEQYADVETRVNWGVWQAAWQASRKQALEEAATKAETEICECCWPDGVREAAEEIAFQIRGLQKE